MPKNTVHVFDFLEQDSTQIDGGVCALFGGERFLKQLAANAISDDGNEYSLTRLDGPTAQYSEVMDELATQSLFGGGGPKIVLIDDADSFVKQHRDRLESVVEAKHRNLLVMLVDSWAANTRLYKSIDKHGFQIRCDAPVQGRSKKPDVKRISAWLVDRAEKTHDFKLPVNGASLLIDLVDCEFGRMDQELQKLALYADKNKKVTMDQVAKVVGGWRTQTMWEAIAAACDGDAGEAVRLLDQLLKTGEHPLALFGQLSWSLRRYSTATEIVLRQVRQGKRPDLSSAVSSAGFKPWGGEVDLAQDRLKQLGRGRAAQILDWLNETDAALKRTHTSEHRGRLALEKLLIKMSSELSPA